MTNPIHQTNGKACETQAERFLSEQGFNIIARNFRCKGGEIDLIALAPDSTLIFVEVRLRTNPNFGSAADSITRSKQARIISCSQFFLTRYPNYQHHSLRFDVILFNKLEQPPQWITSAFDA